MKRFGSVVTVIALCISLVTPMVTYAGENNENKDVEKYSSTDTEGLLINDDIDSIVDSDNSLELPDDTIGTEPNEQFSNNSTETEDMLIDSSDVNEECMDTSDKISLIDSTVCNDEDFITIQTEYDGLLFEVKGLEGEIKEGTTLSVSLVNNIEEKQKIESEIVDELDNVYDMISYNINLVDCEGNIYEPALKDGVESSVLVSIKNSTFDESDLSIFHMNEDYSIKTEIDFEVDDKGTISFETESFSIYTFVLSDNIEMEYERGLDGKDYILIDSVEDLVSFRKIINKNIADDTEITIRNESESFTIPVQKMTHNAKLLSDLNLGDIEWKSIGTKTNPFDGIFDGQSHTVKGIKNYVKSDNMCGFFGSVKNASINGLNVKLSDTQITIDDCEYYGLIAAYVDSSNVSMCNASGNIKGTTRFMGDGADHIGGIVGYAKNTNIEKCGFYGSLSASADSSFTGPSSYAGGIVSYGERTNVSNSFAFGDIHAVTAGGIYGGVYYSCNINECYFIGEGTSKICGSSNNKDIIVTDCYVQSYSDGKGNYNNNIRTREALSGWDFTNIWTFKEGINGNYPFIKENEPSCFDSVYLRPFINNYSKKNNVTILRDKLDLTLTFDREITTNEGGKIYVLNSKDSSDKKNCFYQAEGNELHIFTDKLDRGISYKLIIEEKTIFTKDSLDLYYNSADSVGYGFSVISLNIQGDGSAENPFQIDSPSALNAIRYELNMNYVLTKDIDLSDWNNGTFKAIGSTTEPFTGTLDGRNHLISGIRSYTPNESSSYSWRKIGLFGKGENITIKNLFVSMADDAVLSCLPGPTTYQYLAQCAGLVLGSGSGELINCHVTGNMNAHEDVSYAGLLVGDFKGNISKCSAVGTSIASLGRDLTNGSTSIGGLVGRCEGKISNCYAIFDEIKGEATGGASSTVRAGGIAGSASSIMYCYAKIGSIKTNKTNNGGASGLCGNETANIYSSFYSIDNEVKERPVGSKKTFEELKTKSTYVGWDYNSTWIINDFYNEGYPTLRDMIIGEKIKYYMDSQCSKELPLYRMLVFDAGINKVEVKKELPLQAWVKSDESTQEKLYLASIKWNIDFISLDSYPDQDSITELVGTITTDDVLLNELLQPIEYKVLINRDIYQDYFNSYGMYPKDFFSQYSDYVDNAYSDAVFNECEQVALEAMNTVSTTDIVVAAVFEAFNLNNEINKTFRDLFSKFPDGDKILETDVDRFYDDVLLQIIKEYAEYDDSTNKAIKRFIGKLYTDISKSELDYSSNNIFTIVAEIIVTAEEFANPEGDSKNDQKLAKKATSLANALNTIWNDGKENDSLSSLKKYFGLVGDTKNYTDLIIELGILYACQEIICEEISPVIEQCDSTELKAAMSRLEKKLESPYEYIITKIATDLGINELTREYQSILSFGSGVAIGTYINVCEYVISTMRNINELNAPSYGSIYSASIANEYYRSISKMEETLKEEFKDNPGNASYFEKYSIAYTLRIVALRAWLKNCSGVLGSWDSTQNDNTGIKKLINSIDIHSDIRRDINGGKDVLLGDGLTFYKYIGSCMYDALQKNSELPVPIITYEIVDSETIRITVDSNDKDMVYFYTTDGSIPVKNSQVNLNSVCRAYKGAFLVDRDTVVKVRGYLSGKIASDVTTFYLRYDSFWDEVCDDLLVLRNCEYEKYTGNHYRVPEKVFNLAKENGIDLKFTFDNKNVWEIKSNRIEDERNLILKAETLSDKDLEALPIYSLGLKNDNFLGINMSYDGVLGLTTTLKYYVGRRFAGRDAYLYFYNDILNSFEKQAKTATVSADGYVEFDFVHCSKYIIVFSDAVSFSDNTSTETDRDNNFVNSSSYSGSMEFSGDLSASIEGYNLNKNNNLKDFHNNNANLNEFGNINQTGDLIVISDSEIPVIKSIDLQDEDTFVENDTSKSELDNGQDNKQDHKQNSDESYAWIYIIIFTVILALVCILLLAKTKKENDKEV